MTETGEIATSGGTIGRIGCRLEDRECRGLCGSSKWGLMASPEVRRQGDQPASDLFDRSALTVIPPISGHSPPRKV
jgi:hypothetical protein